MAASLDTPAAFERVFERHHAAVHRYLGRRLGTDLADELAAEVIESERDVAGRPGVGVAVDHAGYRSVLIFKRDSYELLGENERHDGKLTGGSAILDSRVLDSMDRPPVTRR